MKVAYLIVFTMLFGAVYSGRITMNKAMNLKGKPATTVKPARDPVHELIQKVKNHQAVYFDISFSGTNPHFNHDENLVVLSQVLIAKACFDKRFFQKELPKFVNCDAIFSMGKPARKMDLEIRERYNKLVDEHCSKPGNCIYY